MSEDYYEEDIKGYMESSAKHLGDALVGHRIVRAEVAHPVVQEVLTPYEDTYSWEQTADFVIELDNGKQVALRGEYDCCAYAEISKFLLDPTSVDHIITGVETHDGYTRWNIMADATSVLDLDVEWSAGNGYYLYGFSIAVQDIEDEEGE